MDEYDDCDEKREVEQGKIDHIGEDALDGGEKNLLGQRANLVGRK
jgi:hypothetical protein